MAWATEAELPRCCANGRSPELSPIHPCASRDVAGYRRSEGLDESLHLISSTCCLGRPREDEALRCPPSTATLEVEDVVLLVYGPVEEGLRLIYREWVR
jgi:hypothetical protein